MPDQIIHKLWIKLFAEDSLIIMNEQIAEEWKQLNPEFYALMIDFADSLTKAWNRLRMMLNRVLIRRLEYPTLEWKLPIVSRCGKDIGICSSSNSGSPFSDHYSLLLIWNVQTDQFQLPDCTELHFRIKGYPLDYLGRHADHEWGQKFERLEDAVRDCRMVLQLGRDAFIYRDNDQEFPYVVAVPAWRSRETVH